MSDQIKQSMQNLQEQLTEYYQQTMKENSPDCLQPQKQILLNRTNKSKSQHALQKIISTQSSTSIKKLQSKQNDFTKEVSQFSQHSQLNQTTDMLEQTNDIINIKELINEKKMQIANKNKYYLQEITKIRKNFEMKAEIRNKMKQERKPSSSSQELYEQCWDATLEEINQEIKDNQLIIDSNINRKNKNSYKKRPKPLRTQLFHKMLEQETSFFKQKSDSLLKLMKKATIQIVDEVNSQNELASLLQKERQQQRSKEREEGKQDIIKSFRFKEQERLVKLLQNKSSNRYQRLRKQQPDSNQNDSTNSFSKLKKLRSSSFNCALPQISQKTDKDQISHKTLEKKQIKEKVLQIARFPRKNLLTKSEKNQSLLI